MSEQQPYLKMEMLMESCSLAESDREEIRRSMELFAFLQKRRSGDKTPMPEWMRGYILGGRRLTVSDIAKQVVDRIQSAFILAGHSMPPDAILMPFVMEGLTAAREADAKELAELRTKNETLVEFLEDRTTEWDDRLGETYCRECQLIRHPDRVSEHAPDCRLMAALSGAKVAGEIIGK